MVWKQSRDQMQNKEQKHSRERAQQGTRLGAEQKS